MLDKMSVLSLAIKHQAFDKDSFISKIFPSGIEPFIVQISAMVVLVVAFFVFFFKPVRKILDARRNKMMDEITEAEKKNSEAQVLLSEANSRLKNSKTEADAIITQAKKEADTMKEDILADAQEEVVRIKKEASLDIERSREKAQKELNQQMVNSIMYLTSMLLGDNMTDSINEEIVSSYVENFQGK